MREKRDYFSCRQSIDSYNDSTTLFTISHTMISKTREEEQKEYKAKYKAKGEQNRDKKSKDNETKYNDEWQKRVEWFWRVNQ